MKGFFGATGNYYEADEPISPSDTEVPLRPSEAYILAPGGKWVIDRRTFNISPPAPPAPQQLPTPQHPYPQAQTTHQEYHYQQPFQHGPGGQNGTGLEVQNPTKYALFEFLAKNWMALISAAVWAAGTYATLSRTIYDMQTQISQQTAQIQQFKDDMARYKAEMKEQQTTDNARMANSESRYGDLTILLQQIAANAKK